MNPKALRVDLPIDRPGRVAWLVHVPNQGSTMLISEYPIPITPRDVMMLHVQLVGKN